jgi:hypothetical protein
MENTHKNLDRREMLRKKYIRVFDFFVIVCTLVVIIGLIGYTKPMMIAPSDKFTTANTSVLFAFEKSNLIYIDDTPEFTSPDKIYVKDNLTINLKPGKYYWKIEGVTQSEIREFTINSNVGLTLRKSDDKYEVVNSGNSRLNVDIYDKGTLVGNIILDVDKSTNVSGDKFIGGDDE